MKKLTEEEEELIEAIRNTGNTTVEEIGKAKDEIIGAIDDSAGITISGGDVENFDDEEDTTLTITGGDVEKS